MIEVILSNSGQKNKHIDNGYIPRLLTGLICTTAPHLTKA